MSPAPYRPRTPSGHDVPIPESVFLALADVQASVHGVAQAVALQAAASEARFAKTEQTLSEVKAAVRDKWVGLAKVMIPGVLAIIGTIVAARPTLPAPEVRAVKSLVEVRVEHECDPLPIRSQERFECFQRVYADTERR